MYKKLQEIRESNPNFDKNMVDMFAKSMPKLLMVLIDGEKYDKHIGSKDVAMLAEPFITNNKGEHIGFHWDYDKVISAVKGIVDLDESEFYPCDIFVWANVKYGDMQHITSDSSVILKYAVSELTDSDFPFYDASQRAYYWLKKHIEEEERE